MAVSSSPIGRADPMIAEIALKNGLVLVSGNVSHYQRIQTLGYELRLENWRERDRFLTLCCAGNCAQNHTIALSCW